MPQTLELKMTANHVKQINEFYVDQVVIGI